MRNQIYPTDLKYRQHRNLKKKHLKTLGTQYEALIHENLDTIESRLKMCQQSGGEILDLSNLSLTELPQIPNGIKSLFLDNNLLVTLPDLDHLKNLEIMDCTCNRLITFGKLPISLSELMCRNNKLIRLPVLNQLEKLDVSHNQLKQIPKMIKLKILVCNDCGLRELPMLPELRKLTCNNNKITRLESYHQLTDLVCVKNRLTKIPVMSKLQELVCDENKVRIIPNLESLQFLSCIHNPLDKLTHHLRHLKELTCDFRSVKLDRKYKLIKATRSSKFMKFIFETNHLEDEGV